MNTNDRRDRGGYFLKPKTLNLDMIDIFIPSNNATNKATVIKTMVDVLIFPKYSQEKIGVDKKTINPTNKQKIKRFQ